MNLFELFLGAPLWRQSPLAIAPVLLLGEAGCGFGGCQRGYFQCDHILDTVVFAAIIYVLCRHGEPMA